MKKAISVLLAVLLLAASLVGCSSDKGEETSKGQSNIIETEKAVIKDAEAVKLMQNAYTAEELGLSEVGEDYSFMISNSGVEIDGSLYVKVAANVMSENDVTSANGEKTYSLTPVGEYYISYDGETVLRKDLESGEYSRLENRYAEFKKQSADKPDASVNK